MRDEGWGVRSFFWFRGGISQVNSCFEINLLAPSGCVECAEIGHALVRLAHRPVGS